MYNENNLAYIKVKVESLAEGLVGYKSANLNRKRVWTKKGQAITIPADELSEVLFEDEIKKLFTLGYLGIENAEHRKLIDLDIQDYSSVEPFTEKKAIELLNTPMTKADFKNKIETLVGNQIDVLVSAAVEAEDIPVIKVEAIKEIFGIDIMSKKLNKE